MHSTALEEKNLPNSAWVANSLVAVIVCCRLEVINWFEDERFLGTPVKEYPP